MHALSIRSLCSKIVFPVIREFPIILVFFVLIKVNLIEFFQDNDLDSVWDYISVFSVWFLYIYFIAVTICFFKKQWVRWLWYALLFSVYAVSCFIAAHFEMQICPALMTLLVETNRSETEEFLNTYLFTSVSIKIYIKIAVYIVFAVLVELGYRRYLQNRKVRLDNIWAAFLIVSLLFAGLFRWSQYSDYFHFSQPDDEDVLDFPANDIYTRLFCSICIESKQSNVILKAVDVSLNAGNATTIIKDNDSLNVIFVIGESFIKSHSNLYGYPLMTTPNLQSQKEKGNLFAFTDVITPYNYTSMSVKNMMSCNSICDSEKWYNLPYFPVLFKKAGYRVYFWSNQHRTTNGSVYQYALDSYLYNPMLSSYTYDNTNRKTFDYDGKLVDDFNKTIIDTIAGKTHYNVRNSLSR